MNYRDATAADRTAVIDLAMHFHESSPYGQLLRVDPERVGALFDVALVHGVVLLAQVEAGPLAAFIALVALEHTLSGDLYAEEAAWWVEPTYRSGTVGPRLLRLAEEWCLGRGCAFIKMAAPIDTEVAAFYVRLGYSPIETAFLKRLTPEVP